MAYQPKGAQEQDQWYDQYHQSYAYLFTKGI